MTKPLVFRSTAVFAVLSVFAVLAVFAVFASHALAQNPRSTAAADSPQLAAAPRRDLSGTWTPADRPNGAIQAKGVQAMPNDGAPEHELPYTPYGLELYKSHKALEGLDAVLPAFGNDPRNKCEPLGFPRMNHYNVRMTQIFQNPHKMAILYEYDKRWRDIWIDGRELPRIVEGGIMDGETFKEPRFYGYSVGEWTDDSTLVVKTVGMMPEDRVWLDSTGRPISDAATVTEEFRRIDRDTLEWTEIIDDPKVYTKPWMSMKILFKLADPHTDVLEMYCSPVEMQQYYESFGNAVSEVENDK